MARQKSRKLRKKDCIFGRPTWSSLGCLFLLLSILGSRDLSADAQNDFDLDGVSDITYTSGASSLLWNSKGSKDGTEQLGNTFQLSGDTITLAHWEGEGAPVLGIARLDPDGSRIFWKIPSSESDKFVETEYLGNAGDAILSGGDFDGNGVADAVVVVGPC